MARRVSLIPALHAGVGVAVTVICLLIRPREGDPGSFLNIVAPASRGFVAYLNYEVEYPPLGLVHLALPRLLGGTTPNTYQTIFSLISLALAIGTGVAVYWLARLRWSAESPRDVTLMFVGLTLAGVPLVVWRFDILPAFLTAVALLAYAVRRPGWSGMMLGLGFAAKVYPLFLVPVFAAAQLFERRWRDLTVLAVAAGGTILLVFGEVFLRVGSREFYFLIYQRNRGVEVESITGGIAMLAGALGLSPTKVSFDFGSDQVSSPLLTAIATPNAVFEALVVVVLVAAAVYSFRRDVRATGRVQALTLVQYSLATVLVGILANKVLSPQYIVWLLPFAPLMSARKSLFFLVITVLTLLEYPFNFDNFVHLQVPAALLVNLRNVLLVAYFAWVVWPQRTADQAAIADQVDSADLTAAPDLHGGYVRDPT
jgi:uncharacterized membrane protein